jgi:hypothetical protein
MNKSGRIAPMIVAVMSLTTAAWGYGFGPGGPHGGGGHWDGHPGDRLLERLVFPCRAGCFDASRTCFGNVASTAETCVAGSCPSEITAAQTACKPGRTSACRTTMDTLRTCAGTCSDTAATSFTSCRTTMTGCLATCGQS